MPDFENELSRLTGKKHFATFDLSYGYWQLPLHPDSQELQSFLTLEGVYTPTRVLHGTTSAVTSLQSSLAAIIPPELAKMLLRWLDDILAHAEKVSELLDTIEMFFEMVKKHRLKLQPAKCTLYSKTIRWCGRLMSGTGIRFDPSGLDALLQMEAPTNGAHLQQFICALQWYEQEFLISPYSYFLFTIS